MKVFNLQCSARHAFEGWFASEADHADQMARGLLACQICGDHDVQKLPSAPRLNLGAGEPARAADTATRGGGAVVAGEASPGDAQDATRHRQALQSAYLQFARRVMEQTEDVGTRFADEARRIHYGEAAERGIRGQASAEETEALLEEGVPVLPLPLPEGWNGKPH